MNSQQTQQAGPPYRSPYAAIGGQPTVGVDVPICAVFTALYLTAAIGHMYILQVNRRRGHKFLMSGAMFGFCMARITTCIMRIVWATRPDNLRVAIAASVFVSAGVLLLFVINLIFAQRLIRAAHPHFGWHKAVKVAFMILYILIVLMLAMVITATVQSFYTLDMNTRIIDRDLQLTASTYLLFFSFLPIPMVILGLIVPRKTRLEKFGSGRWRTKIAVLLTASTLLCLGAAFRTGTSFMPPRLATNPAWYQAKWCFYFFNFVLEILVIYLYLIVRVDLRFFIPNGSKGPGDYSRDVSQKEEVSVVDRINTEEEMFDDATPHSSSGDVERLPKGSA